MRLKLPLTFITLALLACPAAARRQDDRRLIDDFVLSRGVSFEEPSKPRPKPKQTAQSGGRNRPSASRPPRLEESAAAPKGASAKGAASADQNSGSSNQNTGRDGAAGAGVAGPKEPSGSVIKASGPAGGGKPIGLGYTLFMKQGDNLVAADPSRAFSSGDKLRLVFETNTDGYIYIFNAENDRKPVMLYPHVTVDDGANFVRAHARDFVPADLSAWFEFDANPAVEHVYLILSREPLAGVPTGKALAEFCGADREGCYWEPSAELWARLKAGAKGGSFSESKNVQLAKMQPLPNDALARGIKVKKEEPAPAVVRVNNSAATSVLVTTVNLIHK